LFALKNPHCLLLPLAIRTLFCHAKQHEFEGGTGFLAAAAATLRITSENLLERNFVAILFVYLPGCFKALQH
jgi:hypothetical protein